MKPSHPHANERRTPKALVDQTAGLDLFNMGVPAEILTGGNPSANYAALAAREPAPAVTEAEKREIAHAAQKSKHPELIAKLRIAARTAYATHQRPVSTNDLRDAYDQDGADVDARVLAVAFAESYWAPFGTTQTNCSSAERAGVARSTIRTYVPKHLLSMWEEKLKADERRTA